jgi:CelD/BcsL family acetyltransferase involved in cellulose biosynthesis
LNTSVIPGGALTEADLLRWSAIQEQTDSLASPFFSPQFTAIVASVRDDVAVARLEAGDRTIGFFPFERGRFGEGRPVGSILSDYHGLIALPDVSVDCADLIRSCGLRTWGFHHLLASQACFDPFIHARRSSTLMDLSGGFDAYVRARQEAGVRIPIASAARKSRKLERDHGPLRYSQHTADAVVFETLMSWKSAQYERTGAANPLDHQWIRDVLTTVWATESEGFAGMLSTLYTGDRLAAVHLGLRSSRVWHSWFPAYDPALASYSPGLILLLRMAESAQGLDLRAIDLGPGAAPYKQVMMSHGVSLAEGSVDTTVLAALATRTRRTTRALVRHTGLARKIRPMLRGITARVPRR